MSTTRLLATLIALLSPQIAPGAPPESATFVARDRDHLFAVVYDGAQARVLDGTEELAVFPAGSVLDALWGVDLPVRSELRAARLYDRVLAPEELEILARREWSDSDALWVCHGPGLDDCAPEPAPAPR